VALDRAFLLDPLPTDEFAFKRRVEEGRGRLTLIANEVARLAATILTEYAAPPARSRTPKTPPRPRDAPSSNCSA
jgi:ATP-dependent helicase HrpA